VGRYLYAQIPRTLSTAQLTFGELESQAAELALTLERQNLFPADELAPLLRVPSPEEVRGMSLVRFLLTILVLDLARPFRVSFLRRRVLRGVELIPTLGGLLPSGHEDLETVISSARRQSWLRAKMAFLERTRQVFHLWHVVHRPFSYTFAVLAVVHVTVVLLLGYY
jgi:hypothetical protein